MIKSLSISESSLPRPGSLALNFIVDDLGTIPLEFRLWLGELTGENPADSQVLFFLPSTVFLSRIDDFNLLRRRFGNFQIAYDDYFASLVDLYAKEKEQLSFALSHPEKGLTPEEVTNKLEIAGFLRWQSQSDDQLRDIGRLALLPNGANFSVPGAGKTNTLLAVYSIAKLDRPNLKLLVVCPKNAMLSWDEEVASCLGASKKVVRLEGNKSQLKKLLAESPNYSVISYQKLSGAIKEIIAYMQTNEVHLVLDESHRIKAGENSQQGAAAIMLSNYAVRRDILSGTPMPQGFSDLVAQFNFLWPNLNLFRRIPYDQEAEEQIRQANQEIKPYFVRTTKGELGLPKPKIRYIPVEMSDQQAQTYQLLKNETARYIAGLNPEDKEELRAIGKQIMRVLQFCSDPKLLLNSLPPNFRHGELFRQLEFLSNETSNKLKTLDSLVHKTMNKPGEKVVIWSMFVDQIESLVSRYKDFGATSIHGGVPTGPEDDLAFREARIARFKSEEACRVLVANPSACGEGISLHKAAHHAIYFDRSFNAAHFLQSIDRIHRRGLPKGTDTYVDILSLEGTIEDAVRKRLSDKIKMLQELLDDEDLSAMVFDPEDLEFFGEDDDVSLSDIEEIMKSLAK